MKHIVGFSGGIDSQACARWVLNRVNPMDVILLNSDAGGWESPLTVSWIDWYSENVHPVTPIHALVADMWATEGFAETKGYDGSEPLTFQLMCKIKGRAPSRRAQFCTNILKIVPQKRWINENLKGIDYCRYTGLRKDKSDNRKDTAAYGWDDYFDCALYNPIFDWTKQMAFDYVKAHGEKINPLYTLGFNRVGCAPCVNSSKDDILAWHQRFPDQIDKVRMMEREMDRTFFPPMVPGMELNFIDDVLRWAETSRGGRQANMLRVLDRPACESKYGLCE